MDKCLRCGKCCYFLGYPCTHLCFHNGKTFCDIYDERKGLRISTNDDVFMCGDRINSDRDYSGCPYNTKKPMSFKFKEKESSKEKEN